MTKKSLYIAVLLGAVIMLISACDINVIRGTGDLITETREVSNFDSIELAGSGDVVVVQNGNETLSVETDDNVMRFVVTEVRNGTLHLGLESESSISGISPSQLVFTVGIADLEGLAVSGFKLPVRCAPSAHGIAGCQRRQVFRLGSVQQRF